MTIPVYILTKSMCKGSLFSVLLFKERLGLLYYPAQLWYILIHLLLDCPASPALAGRELGSGIEPMAQQLPGFDAEV